MKKFLLTMLVLNSVFFVNIASSQCSNKIDCNCWCKNDAGFVAWCTRPVGPGQSQPTINDISGKTYSRGIHNYCGCRCGGYANGGIAREIRAGGSW